MLRARFIFFLSIGVSFSIQASLDVSPVSSLSYSFYYYSSHMKEQFELKEFGNLGFITRNFRGQLQNCINPEHRTKLQI